MIARLLISLVPEARIEAINRMLTDANLSKSHPDLLYFSRIDKLGIAEARKIKEHFSLKPYSAEGRAVVLEDAANLTIEAQNALLKTLEEPPADAILLLGASSEAKFLPTILSRCEVIRITSHQSPVNNTKILDIEKLLSAGMEERFEYVEKLKDREEFLKHLIDYFHQQLISHPNKAKTDFLKELLQAEEWAAHNVNIRAILEYLMLVMPKQMW